MKKVVTIQLRLIYHVIHPQSNQFKPAFSTIHLTSILWNFASHTHQVRLALPPALQIPGPLCRTGLHGNSDLIFRAPVKNLMHFRYVLLILTFPDPAFTFSFTQPLTNLQIQISGWCEQPTSAALTFFARSARERYYALVSLLSKVNFLSHRPI
jgi:hypothetical protein